MKTLDPALMAPIERIADIVELPPSVVAQALAIGLNELDCSARMLVECPDPEPGQWPATRTLN